MTKMKNLIKEYVESINSIFETGETTEHSFRGDLVTLLKALRPKSIKNKQDIEVINEAKRKTYGAPDVEIRKGDVIISFIETKDIDDKDLRGTNEKSHKEQFDRYKKAIDTIAFTDYLEFVLFEKGKETISARIARRVGNNIVIAEDEEQIMKFGEIIKRLFEASAEPIRSAKVLTETLAAKAKLISSILQTAMKNNETKEDKELHHKLNAFKKFLVHDMTEEQFVDFYAQTIVYGMFIARIYDETPQNFSLLEAADLIPKTNPFLKRIFKLLALADLHTGIKWIVDELVEIFKVTNMEKVLRNYGKEPLVHFYEDFLEEYNPKIREDFGVWYTPQQVVRFIVDAVDYLLKTELNIHDGLADNSIIDYQGKQIHKVQILDPATGTGTFLATAAEKIRECYIGQEGLWAEDVVKHIIPRMNGFEYLMAPYTMAHLKLSTSLGLDKINSENVDRLRIFLTNSLEEEHPEETLDFAKFITDESNAANVIKRETPVMVVIGNPPYNEKSANTGEWITNLMNDYKQEPGQERILINRNKKTGKCTYKNTLKATNPKGINNDYCKFIRLGQNFVEKTQEGVLAYISGNTFLDTRLFRGMRYNLLKEFDEIYILNLHGSSKRDEGSDDVKDECVFNIKVGVSINIFIKRKSVASQSLATVYYKDIYGTRREKLNYLLTHSFVDIGFEVIQPFAPIYAFRTRNEEVRQNYEQGFRIRELMPEGVKQGLKSGFDTLVMHHSRFSIDSFCQDIVNNMDFDDVKTKYGFTKSERGKYNQLKERVIIANYNPFNNITKIAYRPFDYRWTIYSRLFLDRPRPEIQKNILNKDNIVLCLGQEGSSLGDCEWSLVYCADIATDINMIPRGGVYIFPLYIYDGFLKTVNFSSTILQSIETSINRELQNLEEQERQEGGFLAVDLVDYIYAVLHSVTYRDTYHDFLQNDFPIIPYPKSAEYFFNMADLGKQLRELHQLKGIEQKDFITQFPKTSPTDNNIVRLRKFEETGEGIGKVWINKHQYFDNVPTAAWNMIISGYQVLDKWLKDRKDRHLDSDEIRHYQKIVVALVKTIEIQEGIDNIIQL